MEYNVIVSPDGTRRLDSKLTELRSVGIGWYYGDMYRNGTMLEKYVETETNEAKISELIDNLQELDNTTKMKKRAKLIDHILDLDSEIEKKVVYRTFEDGMIDRLPQESTIYLLQDPAVHQRALFNMGVDSEKPMEKLRVEANYLSWPANIPALNHMVFGEGRNKVSVFDKMNLEGYSIKDRYGEIARVEIEDFILYYGNDLVYHYYLDKNGDGKINKKTEEISLLPQLHSLH